MDIIESEYKSEHESSSRVSETVNPGNVIWRVGQQWRTTSELPVIRTQMASG